VRLVQAQGLDVGDAQLVAGDAEATQGHVLGDGVVLAVGGALNQRLDRSRPIVFLLPDLDVVGETQRPVEEVVDRAQLGRFVERAALFEQAAPVAQA
jgi:hypothetical protein